MKNSIVFKNTWLVLAILSITFVSCKKNPEYLQLIPTDSPMVVTIDLMSLTLKADMEKVAEMEFYKSLQTELETENKQLFDLLKELEKKPASSGIDLRHDIVLFLNTINQDDMYIYLTAELTDADKFRELAEKVAATADKTMTVQKNETFSYTLIDSSGVLAWDARKALLVAHVGDSAQSDCLSRAQELFTQEENLSSNKEFADFISHNKDINFWMNMGWITKLPELESLVQQMGSDMYTDSYLKMYGNFENGKIVSTSEIVPNEAMKALYDSTRMFEAEFNSELMKYLPEQNYMAVSYAIDMQAYYDMMVRQPQFKEALAGIENQMGLNMEQLMVSLGGSILIDIHGFNPIPLFSMSFDVNDSEHINQLVSQLTGTEVVDNAITSINLVFLELHFINKGGLCYLTNDKAVADAVLAGNKVKDNLKESAVGKNIAKYPVYMFVNLDLEEYPAEVINELTSNPKASAAISMIDSYAKNFEGKMIDTYKGEFTLTTNESNKNSLYTLLSLIDEYYQQITEL